MSYSAKTMHIRAMIVGINNYIASEGLRYCVDDATSVRDLLQSIYHKKSIVLIADDLKPRFTPLRNNILSNIKLISRIAEEKDNIIFYFAGHGKDIMGEPAVLPSDYRDEIGLDAAIKIEDIKDEFANSKAKFKLMVLDSCHSGAVKGRAESGRMSKLMFDAINDVPKGFAIFSACGLNQISFEDEKLRHGVFTFFLLEGLKGKADINGNGEVTINELYDYVTQRVKNRVFQEYNASQIPHMRANFSGVYIVNRLQKETLESKGGIESFQDIESLSRLQLFKEVFKFANSSSGMDMYKRDAKEFASQWLKQHYNKNFNLFQEVFNFANSSSGMNMYKRDAREFAFKWLEKYYDKDFNLFKDIFNFANSSSGMNMYRRDAREYALQWLEQHK